MSELAPEVAASARQVLAQAVVFSHLNAVGSPCEHCGTATRRVYKPRPKVVTGSRSGFVLLRACDETCAAIVWAQANARKQRG